jgi:DNA polymerase epsilon subunit 1
MSKSVEDSGDLKSAAITTARRIAEMLGNSNDGTGNSSALLREKGLSCHLIIANRPLDAKASDRAIPVGIFKMDVSSSGVYFFTGSNP